MIEVRVSSNVRRVRKGMSRWARRVLPEATRNALNDTAFELRNYIVRTLYPRSFPQARNKRFAGVAFRVEKATKSRQRASVFDRLDRVIFDRHIRGERKRPFKGSAIAVPVNAKRTASGKIRAADQPGRNPERTFVADLRGRGRAIWRRKGRRGSERLELLFVLKDSTPQTAKFPFFRQGIAFVRRRFPRIFERETGRSLKRLERRLNSNG
ncbi:MAG: hypothetical protein AAF515_05105 [Pseudomonadota bacterium]